MASTKQMIELEVRQVQEQLLKLIEERKNLQKEFEQLTGSSHQLLLQIKEDTTSASERKLHGYEAEKKRIEEKLEALENEILEKDGKIVQLDSKAGEFLQQVSTTPTSNNLSNINEKVEVDVIGDECTSARTVGEEGKSVEGARDGVQEVQIKENEKNAMEGSQSVGDSHQNIDEEHELKECNNSDPGENEEESESYGDKPVATVVTSPEELHENNDDSATSEHTDREAGEVTGTGENELNGGEEKCKEQENEKEVVVLVDNIQSCLDDKIAEEEKPKATNTHEPCGISVSEKEDRINQSDVQSKLESQEVQPDTSNQPTVSTGDDIPKEDTPAVQVGIVANGDTAGKQPSDSSSPVNEQVTSLSLLVAELRRVKDDMGKCMTVKEQSFLELEDQLQAANKEVSALKSTMSVLEKDLEEKRQSYLALENENKIKKMDIELKIGEIQGVTNKCTMLNEEKADLLRKMEVLEIMMTEYRTEIEMLIAEKNQMEQQTKQLLAAKTAANTAEAEIDSKTSVEEKEKEIEELVEKIQSMEKEMKELNDKLKVTNRHLKVMAREREYKQRECEILKHKVEMVELKMCELQGTFDMLMKAVMVERDDLIKEMDGKNSQIDDLQQTIVRLKDTHEQELENVLYEKRLSEEELFKYKTGELKSAEAEKKELEEVTKQKECLEMKLKEKNIEVENLEKKVKSIHADMTDFVNTLKDEMARMKDDGEKLQEEKANLAETFNSLQGEHKELQSKHLTMEKSLEELEKSNKEKKEVIESLKTQLEDLQQQFENVSAKNLNMTTEMFKKEEESREELSAREATIQELTVTLTNNQKQSMENYNALQQDMNTLQTKFKTSVEEHKKQQKELEERLKELEKEKVKEINTLQEKVNSLKSDLNEKNEKLQAIGQSQSSDNTKEQNDKDKEIEALNKKIGDLTQALESAKGGSENKESGDTDASHLQQKVKDLTAELATLTKQPSEGGAHESQEEFEASIDMKEKKIKLLESKVGDLEMCLANKSGYITQLEDKLKESPELPSKAETHLEQIKQLSADISKLKEELKQTYEECKTLKNTVSQLESDKKSIEDEKAKIVQEYENKLQQANGSLGEATAQLEQKKNSVERLELELSRSSNRHVEEVAKLESSQVGRIAELVKLHRQKVEILKASNAAKVSELLVHIDKLNEEKAFLETELKKFTLEQNDSSVSTLIQERENLITKVSNLEQTCELLEKEKLQIEEEKKTLKNSFKEERIMAMEMQSQMVTDSEKLILDLEIKKESLEKQIEVMESLCEQHSLTILENQKKMSYYEDQTTILTREKERFIDENRKLKSVIEEMVSRINLDEVKSDNSDQHGTKVMHSKSQLNYDQAFLDEQVMTTADIVNKEKDEPLMQIKVFDKNLTMGNESMKEYDQKKAVLEYEDKISSLIADYQEKLSHLSIKYESKLVEEKAEFGRVLVAKIDHYERKIASQDEEMKNLRSEISCLQIDVCDKVKQIEELEANLDDMTLMRAALRAQVDDLKLAITRANSTTSDHSYISCLDILHAEYETRISEIQEYYEAQLSTLRSCLPGTDVELQAVACGSPSQGSDCSIELSCLRPFLQGQSPEELRSQSAQESYCCTYGDTVPTISVSNYILSKSSSDFIRKGEAVGRNRASTASLHPRIRRKSILKAKAKCKSNGSIPHIVLDSASMSELKVLRLSLSTIIKQKSSTNTSQVLVKPQLGEETPLNSPSMPQSVSPVNPCQAIREQHPPTSTTEQAPAILSAMGAIPKPPCRAITKHKHMHMAELMAQRNREAPPALSSGTTTAALSSTTHPSDLDPNNTALDKYCITMELSACCIPSAVIADMGWDSDSETSAKPSLFFG